MSTMRIAIREQVATNGFAVVDGLLPGGECQQLIGQLDALDRPTGRRRGGVRDLLRIECVRELARSRNLRALVDDVLSPAAFAVRGIYFDKSSASNWQVAWHQDVTIATASRCQTAGFGPWSVKAGMVHVQPPVRVLQHMATVRLHLDACGRDDGALQVIAGSHRGGLSGHRPTSPAAQTCPVQQGGALVMSPLLWHASSKAVTPTKPFVKVSSLRVTTKDQKNPIMFYVWANQ